MPDIVETRLSPDEIRTRRAAMRDAVASARIEGAEVSPARSPSWKCTIAARSPMRR